MGDDTTMDALEPLAGEWRMAPRFDPPIPLDAGASVVFEWLPGRQFLVQRWEVPIPEAPDGIAIIGADRTSPGRYVQHYFDTRGVARRYKMTFAGGQWELWRDEPDDSPLHFRQRFTGTLSPDGTRIDGRWEICHDSETWEHDFDLVYERVG